jgi:hypothetical protein
MPLVRGLRVAAQVAQYLRQGHGHRHECDGARPHVRHAGVEHRAWALVRHLAAARAWGRALLGKIRRQLFVAPTQIRCSGLGQTTTVVCLVDPFHAPRPATAARGVAAGPGFAPPETLPWSHRFSGAADEWTGMTST